MTALKYERNDRSKQIIREKCKEYIARAEKLKEFVAKQGKKKAVANGSKSTDHDGDTGDDEDDDNPEMKKLRGALSGRRAPAAAGTAEPADGALA